MKHSLFLTILVLIFCLCCVLALSACQNAGKLPNGNGNGQAPEQGSGNGQTTEGGGVSGAHTCTYNAENVCSVCKTAWPYTENLLYEFRQNGTSAVVVGGNSKSDTTNIGIPYYFKGVPVKGIKENAFRYYDKLASVTIPASITNIGADAFSGCDRLREVRIVDLAAWCNIGFDNASSNPLDREGKLYLNGILVTALNIPNTVSSIKEGAFYDLCENVTSVIIPASVTDIGDGAFYNSSGLTDIVIPASVVHIGSSTFYNCSKLSTVRFEDNSQITCIGKNAFGYCGNLVIVDFGKNSQLETIEQKAFQSCNSLTSITIPEKVTNIEINAFYGCKALTAITILSNITSIQSYAFAQCTNLVSVTIPASVKSIAYAAFSQSFVENCIVYYGGSESEWKILSQEIDIGNERLKYAKRYYYSATSPTVAGNWWHYDSNGDPVVWS